MKTYICIVMRLDQHEIFLIKKRTNYGKFSLKYRGHKVGIIAELFKNIKNISFF